MTTDARDLPTVREETACKQDRTSLDKRVIDATDTTARLYLPVIYRRALAKGAVIMLSTKLTSSGHIVKLNEVVADGILLDDPFGCRVDKEAGKRIECPMLLLLAQGGPLDTFFGKDGGPGNLGAMGSARARTFPGER